MLSTSKLSLRLLQSNNKSSSLKIFAPLSTMTQAPLSVPKGSGFVDLHSHLYLPKYVEKMKSRTTVPKIVTVNGDERIVLLPKEDEDNVTATGRPFGKQYWSIENKIEFMDIHNIDTSVISLANPWLDFITDAGQAQAFCEELNTELEHICAASNGRLLGFGVLSVPAGSVDHSVAELNRIAKELPHIRGIIMGTTGRGKGLDDPEMEPIYKALEEHGLTAFIHPHYGLGTDSESGYGHVLPLALGFPFETSAAVARLVLSGMLDRVPNLKLLLSHSGGTLPFLAGRLDSCADSDEHVHLKHPPSEYLKRFYYDAINYNKDTLEFVIKFASLEHIVFGTDHPFFPPKEPKDAEGNPSKWPSTEKVQNSITGLNDEAITNAIARDNAFNLLNLTAK